MQFAKLRLSGFKSFVDPTDIPIEPGVTGVVGPNGCGKSNLVEALRWVMGESSAKRIRGNEMDDVIFGGTSDRPSRNFAEVTLWLDNTGRRAPAPYGDADELEISRRIEREGGSDYRINGKHVRARDVHLLLQDNRSGPNSAALVSQGRVGSLIGAKPAERRMLLEEAAGIIGLHSRRHEAEQRLRGAEDNLARLDDIIAAMDGQLSNLKRQVRQATRYRNLSQGIRDTEATLLHIRWRSAQERTDTANAALKARQDDVSGHVRVVAQASAVQADAASRLPQARRDEAEAAAGLQRLLLAREAIDAEASRIEDARTAAQNHLAQINLDLQREEGLEADAKESLKRLADERRGLVADQQTEAASLTEAEERLAQAQADAERREADLTALTEAVATAEADRRTQSRRIEELSKAVAGAERHAGDLQTRLARVRDEIASAPNLLGIDHDVEAAELTLERLRGQADEAEESRQKTESALARLADAAQAASGALTTLRAEAAGLRSALTTADDSGQFAPVIDAIAVAPGYEAALGAALGEDINAPTDVAAPAHWRPYAGPPPEPSLPQGAEPLATHVEAPSALLRRLSHIGVVADSAAGDRLAAALAPGQQLVTQSGDHWRWDGFCTTEGAPSSGAVRLQQRNRLDELTRQIESAETVAERCAAERQAAKAADEQARASEKDARQRVQQAFAVLDRARNDRAKAAEAAAARQSRADSLEESLRRAEMDRTGARTILSDAQAALSRLPDSGAKRQELADLRADVAERRAALASLRHAVDGLKREAEQRRRRLDTVAADERSWGDRIEKSQERLVDLAERAAVGRESLDKLAEQPGALAARRDALLDRISDGEAERRRAGDVLAEAETSQAEADARLREAERDASTAREALVRAEAEVDAAASASDGLRDRIAERLDRRPDALTELAPIDEAETMDPSALETRLEKLIRDRQAMGPVNLRAEAEASELDEQIAGMNRERDDLVAAIGRLRQGIANLNREARERLITSFDTVDRHFRELFCQLFDGGQAHLQLTDPDDPLHAGLDIFASPPGKRLQHLSLLSGGEQALTAIALLFAVFLTNPAPVCVLDEVDAPLDDANVDRFCGLLTTLADSGATRFLVITHHRVTMARVDRLFGVTMPERGVSQLVSVSLESAESFASSAQAEDHAGSGARRSVP